MKIMPRRLLLALSFFVAAIANAQVDPSLHWRTIRTAHFQVTFSPGLEETARRAAGSAERAWEALSKELTPPRGPVSLVVADNLDISNGYATPFPSNRIVVYARPMIDAGPLRFVDDWLDLVVIHELAHIFHLDRTRGLWRLGQVLTGRNPDLFPGSYVPNWVTEGIAVHYESKLTGAGRILGTEFGATIRAHDLGGGLLRLNALSGASPRYPLGNVVYTYGGPLLEQMAGKGATDGMRKYIDGTAAWLIPFMLNTNAKRGFGFSFDSAYRAWADSVHRESQRIGAQVRALPAIVSGGWFASRPRWVNDSAIAWVSVDAKSVPSLRQVGAGGGKVTISTELNTTDSYTILPNGTRVFAQQQALDPYTQRSDLWIDRSGSLRQLTFGARITQPDARMCEGSAQQSGNTDICVVAVQLAPGAAQLVHIRIVGDRAEIRPLTPPSADVLYTEPRWSRDGSRIAAARWARGGMSRIDILDASGALVLRSIGEARAVTTSPAWGAGDSTIYFSSDRSGRSAIYRANIATGAVVRIAESPTGLVENELSPDGRRIATFQLGNEGFDLAVISAEPASSAAADGNIHGPSRNVPVARSDAPPVPYSAWRSVLPTHWSPEIEDNAGTISYGFSTSGSDVIGRHAWAFRGVLEPESNEPTVSARYNFSGLGNPVVSLGGEEFWDHFVLADSARRPIGNLNRRRMVADAALIFSRPRFRRSASWALGGSYEWRDDRTDPATLINQLDPLLRTTRTYPSLFASASFNTLRQPPLALGPEDGISIGATLRQRWRNGASSTTRATTLSGAVQAHRGFDLGARVHHLLVARLAAATTEKTSSTGFSAGGNSGGELRLAPGVSFGDGRRTYFVRGFEGGAQSGSRAVAASAEYRFPIAWPARGFWKTPLFLSRVSGALFTDAAAAWCPAASSTSPICPRVTPRSWMSSAGAEVHFTAATQYDASYRFRMGFAVPTSGKAFTKSNGEFYFTVGLPF
jgi:hypothetical protein